MTSKLKAVKPEQVKTTKPKIVVYGRGGIGKTWVALDFPNVYYIDTEKGATEKKYKEKLEKAGGMYFGIEQGSQDFNAVIEEVKNLSTEKHGYKTLVIDSFTKLFNIAIANEQDKMARDKKDDTFSASKKPAVSFARRLINAIDKLDMNVIIICHEKALWQNQQQVGFTFDGWDKLEYELELNLHIIKTGESRKAWVKKTRLEGFPDASSFDWSYEEFANKYGKEIIEKEATPITLATPEQITEIKDLLERWKSPEGFIEKCHSKAKAEDWNEYEKDKLQSVINFIKTSLSKPKEEK